MVSSQKPLPHSQRTLRDLRNTTLTIYKAGLKGEQCIGPSVSPDTPQWQPKGRVSKGKYLGLERCVKVTSDSVKKTQANTQTSTV